MQGGFCGLRQDFSRETLAVNAEFWRPGNFIQTIKISSLSSTDCSHSWQAYNFGTSVFQGHFLSFPILILSSSFSLSHSSLSLSLSLTVSLFLSPTHSPIYLSLSLILSSSLSLSLTPPSLSLLLSPLFFLSI